MFDSFQTETCVFQMNAMWAGSLWKPNRVQIAKELK